MRRGQCMGLMMAIVLVLCACTKPDDATLSTQQGSEKGTSGSKTTVSTAVPGPETTTKKTEPTVPPHSELYLPQYTTQQILEYFEEVVLDVEYTDGTGNPSLVQKWTEPIYYRIFGDPTDKDRSVLADFFMQLNEIPGFPGIYAAEDGAQSNLSISFLNQEDFYASFSGILNGEYALGATQYWYYTATNEIYTAHIGYRTDVEQSVRASILIEEIVNTLGITDTVLRTDSIVYQYSDENIAPSDVDWIIMKLLYHPQISCGMDLDACTEMIQKLYY